MFDIKRKIYKSKNKLRHAELDSASPINCGAFNKEIPCRARNDGAFLVSKFLLSFHEADFQFANQTY